MKVQFTTRGDFSKTQRRLERLAKLDLRRIAAAQGRRGVDALRSATPVDSNLAASSWTFKMEGTPARFTLSWHNTDIENGFPVAIMLQYGYSTGTGGYVAGVDYINPAIRPVFKAISDEIRRAVKSA